MTTFTSSLPDKLLQDLDKTSKELKLPKNKLIEKALELFLDEIQKAKYAKSFKRAAKDKDIMAMAEEGMADYYKMLQDFDKEIDGKN
ncbi:ribbon-helix-helix domain-containing protein [Psychroflexus sp. CAK1W]|uniref:ribbon-helix-helix domain-containing protein n=1 Tax=Psychroflexus curvus TaxID=2873595 RepID=UPI001CCF126E|nr:ribbon-helix-helix domain-containing protein [Psychroflexus curvus]MBZ9627382.1 ribbon-helix-helix domain-containing protein [Psychroflexus curvus]